jgi:hypothetical protein
VHNHFDRQWRCLSSGRSACAVMERLQRSTKWGLCLSILLSMALRTWAYSGSSMVDHVRIMRFSCIHFGEHHRISQNFPTTTRSYRFYSSVTGFFCRWKSYDFAHANHQVIASISTADSYMQMRVYHQCLAERYPANQRRPVALWRGSTTDPDHDKFNMSIVSKV